MLSNPEPLGRLTKRGHNPSSQVCYSWWNLSALSILGKLEWIDGGKLCDFVLASQDMESGGIADRPGDWVDVFHTIFGLAGEPTVCCS